MSKQFIPAERRALAEKHGINEQYLYQCLTGRRDMNPAEALRIETESGGVLTRQMLCQKTWLGIWPELAAPEIEPNQPQAPAPDSALRTDVVRRQENRREHDVPTSVDRRAKGGPPFHMPGQGE